MGSDSEFVEEGSMGGGSQGSGGYATPDPPTALTLLALEALDKPDFYQRLKEDPEAAAKSINVVLSENDRTHLAKVHWSVLDAHISEMRDALHLDLRRMNAAGPRIW